MATSNDEQFTCPRCGEAYVQNDEKKWIQCDICPNWFHQGCVGLDLGPRQKIKWTCSDCLLKSQLDALDNDKQLNGASDSTEKSKDPLQEEQEETVIKQFERITLNESFEESHSGEEMLSEEEELKLNAMLKKKFAKQPDILATMEKLIKNEKQQHTAAGVMSETMKYDPSPKKEMPNWRTPAPLSSNHRFVNNVTRQLPQSEYRFVNQESIRAKREQSHSTTLNTNQYDNQLGFRSVHECTDDMSQLLRVLKKQQLEELPTYEGGSAGWAAFYSQYIHTSREGNFQPFENLRRLNKCLKGEARTLVQQKLMFPDLVEDILDDMYNMWGRSDVTSRALVDKLTTMSIPYMNDRNAVMKFRTELDNGHAMLKSMNADEYLNNPLIGDTIVRRFPLEWRKKWSQHITRNLRKEPRQVNFKDLVNWFKEETEWLYFEMPEHENKSKRPSNAQQRKYVNVQDEIELEDNKKRSFINKCLFCTEENHVITECQKFNDASVNDRWDVAKKKYLCFICLKRMHRGECPDRKPCDTDGCDKYHHPKLHHMKKLKTEEQLSVVDNEDCHSTHFKIIPVVVSSTDREGNSISIKCNAILDDGSAPTIMSEALAKKLRLNGVDDPLCMGYADGSTRVLDDSKKVSIDVCGVAKDDRKYTLHRVRTVKVLKLPTPTIDVKSLQEKHRHLQRIQIPQPIPNEKPQLLIGEEHPHLSLTLEFREGATNQPIACRTRLGWIIHGKDCQRVDENNINKLFQGFLCECKNDHDLEQLMEDYFAQEAVVKSKSKKLVGQETQRALSLLTNTVKRIDNRYQAGLLWRSDKVNLPDSEAMANRRLQCLENQMKRNPVMSEAVRQKFKENIEKGYLKKLPAEKAAIKTPRTWYLPTFAVINPHKPGKIRIVYDAAAKVDNVSLNDCLLKGPELLNSLVYVLLNARKKNVAVTGDIKEMYHQIKVRPEDQNSQRVLWRDGDSNKNPDVYTLNVLTFGACCSPATAEYVKIENAKKFEKQFPRATESIIKHHYVDDLFDCFETEDEALEICKQIKEIHHHAGFDIRNWISNSKIVMNALNGESTDQSAVSLNWDKEGTEKILGLHWDVHHDVFMFKTDFVRIKPEILQKHVIPTKRETLKLVMSVFDPLGFCLPVTVRGRILMQEMWRVGLQWDQKLNKELFEKWCKLLDDLKYVEDIRIPRCMSHNLTTAKKIELHIFTDASELACCAVAYLRICHPTGIDVVFVMAKCKVASKKYVTVPRLELEAALLGARMAANIGNDLEMDIDRQIFHSDSRTALSWIKAPDHRKFKSYVAHRVSQILENTKTNEWKWIAGKLNVADEATKRETQIDLTPDSRWFCGPELLLQENGYGSDEIETKFETEEEIRSAYVMMQAIKTRGDEATYSVIDVIRYSNWQRIIRIVAWMRRFVRNVKKAKDEKNISASKSAALTPIEIQEAECIILRKIQYECYTTELYQLKAEEKIESDSKLYKLSAYLDEEGLIRMRGRIDAVPALAIEFKRPIILDRHHALTSLLIQFYHEKFKHANNETVVNEMRQKFFIPELRTAVKKIAKKCQWCKILRASPHIPEMSPLPEVRLMIREKPFSYTGVDYFGPIMVTVGRHKEKRWGVLFTCLVVRAVHIELASTLDTSSCIIAVRNFMSRRGHVKVMYSDNGTNLRGAEAELRKAVMELDQREIQDNGQHPLPTMERTEWRFITPRAPHMGGCWERMVRSIKSVLYATLKERAPKEECLRNMLIESENIVNSRPLTYMPVDPSTMEALTPNHILIHSNKVIYAPGKFSEQEQYNKRWRFSQQLIEEFWKRFVREILPEMRQRTKWFQDDRPVRIGDLVLIIEEQSPRNCWIRGIVIETHPGVDGKIRTVTVKTSGGTYKRPVSKLAVLEVEDQKDGN